MGNPNKLQAIVLLIVTSVMPVHAKIGETVPDLVKRFGTTYRVQTLEHDAGKAYSFHLKTHAVKAIVFDGVSIAETYFSSQPLDASGEPPKDVVQGILKTNLPHARWSETDAASYEADYAMQSSDHEFVAFLRYKKRQVGNWIWTMTVAHTWVFTKNSSPSAPSSTQIPRETMPTGASTITSTPESTPAPTPTPVAMDCPNDDSKDKAPFVFKGFYLGMPLGCAVKLINEKYSDVFGQVAIKGIDQDVGVGFGPMSYRQMLAMAGRKNAEKVAYLIVAGKGSLGPNPVIEADAQKKVIGFRFTSNINDALFNSKELDAKTFALEFGKAYHCTTFGVAVVMEPFRTEDSLGQVRQGWKYDGYDGVHIEITTDKGLEIESVPSSSERKFD
jgi:hypothetical protein